MERHNSLSKSFWGKFKSSFLHHKPNTNATSPTVEQEQQCSGTPLHSFSQSATSPVACSSNKNSPTNSRNSSVQNSPASPCLDVMTSNLLGRYKQEEMYCLEIFQLCLEEALYADYFLKFLEKAYCAESLEFVFQVRKLEKLWNVEQDLKLTTSVSSGSLNSQSPSSSPTSCSPPHASSLIQRLREEEQNTKVSTNNYQYPLNNKSNSFSQIIVQIPTETKRTGFHMMESIIHTYLMDNSDKQLNLASHCKSELLSIYRQYSELWKSKVSNVFLFKVLTNLFQLLEQIKEQIIHQLRIEKFPDFLRSDVFNQILKRKNLPTCIKAYSKLRTEGIKTSKPFFV